MIRNGPGAIKYRTLASFGFRASVSPWYIYRRESLGESEKPAAVREKGKGPGSAEARRGRVDVRSPRRHRRVSYTRTGLRDPVLYTRARPFIFVSRSFSLDAADWHRVHDAGHLSLARVCKVTFTTSAYPGPGVRRRSGEKSWPLGATRCLVRFRLTPVRTSSECKFYSMCFRVSLSLSLSFSLSRGISGL